MPVKGNASIEDQIKHGKHLTFVDKLRASFVPAVGEDEVGNITNPRENFLTQTAARRKEEHDEEMRRNRSKK